ncbi:hypothetical protein GPALN_002043 [Globodera pallida]|nr:hypothetical protein GPALN_002043 [Globodera pallida]
MAALTPKKMVNCSASVVPALFLLLLPLLLAAPSAVSARPSASQPPPLIKRSLSAGPFADYFGFPAAQRAFVGIRTFPSSKMMFGARLLREKLAENRRDERTIQSRQRAAYDRLLCMFATQRPEPCNEL